MHYNGEVDGGVRRGNVISSAQMVSHMSYIVESQLSQSPGSTLVSTWVRQVAIFADL